MKPADRLWVDPLFKKKIKRKALENDMSVLDYTRKIGQDVEENFTTIKTPQPELINIKEKRKPFFGMRL